MAARQNQSNPSEEVDSIAMFTRKDTPTLQQIRYLIESLCGIYSRVARRVGVDRTYVSRVAKGERHSPDVEAALIQDVKRIQDDMK
jgi:hypothetical protein